MMKFPLHKLELIKDKDVLKSLDVAFETIEELQLWDWVASYIPKNNTYMFDHHPLLVAIDQSMFDKGQIHSGASFSLIMQNMQIIARYGVDYWIKQVKYSSQYLNIHEQTV